MFWNLLLQSFMRQRRRKLLAGIAIALGIAIATAMLGVATNIGDKVSHELRAYGANILVTPEAATLDVEINGVNLKPPSDAAYLNEAELPKMKGIFWGHNILAFAPELPLSTQFSIRRRQASATLVGTWFAHTVAFGDDSFVTGLPKTQPWLQLNGAWPREDSAEAVVGTELAKQFGLRAGDDLQIGDDHLRVTGILTGGASDDRAIFAPLRIAQSLLGKPGAVSRVYVSALTKPEDDFARKNPDALSPADKDRWFCSPYANAIARQIQDVLPHAHAEQIRQVAQNEGNVLARISGLMLLISLAAQIAAALAVSAAMATTLFERRREIGLMKALGADSSRISLLFFGEAAILSLVSGVVGFAAGTLLARFIGRAVFGSPVSVQPIILPFVLIVACLITLAGSANAIRRVSKVDPVLALRGAV